MDTTLVIVTVLSMGMAAALSVIVWRLLREERRRSEARVAALQAAAQAPTPGRTAAPAPASAHKPAPVIAAFRAQPRVADAADLPLRTPPAGSAAPAALAAQPLF